MIIILSIIITLFYLILIFGLIIGYDKIKEFHLQNISSKTSFSVVVPFRNESNNLPELLNSISNLNYSNHLYEVILVDDESSDNSLEIINSFIASSKLNNVNVIKNERLTHSPKKDAITKAIKIAKNEWIITTDADCILPKQWLKNFDEFIQKTNSKFIVAPVVFTINNTPLEKFQLLSILSLQGSTIGGFGIGKPFLCNGANLAYTKKLFFDLDGFKGNFNIASGDDIFLMEKAIKKCKDNVQYLKSREVIVTTKSEKSWSSLISQNLRWAAKTSTYSNVFGKLTGFLVLIMNALIVALFALCLFKIVSLKTLICVLIIKFSADFLIIFKTSIFFKQKWVLKSFPISFFIYPFFSVYIAFMSVFKDYKWKGRTFKK